MLSFQIFISTISGAEVMLLLLIILSIILYKKHDTHDFYVILLSALTSSLTTFVLKLVFKVPRPADMVVVANDYRFPSGHATMASVVMTLVIYYSYLYIRKSYLRYTIYGLAIFWYILVSYSRLYVHAHYLVDVVIGGIIGTLSSYLVIHTVRRKRSERSKKEKTNRLS